MVERPNKPSALSAPSGPSGPGPEVDISGSGPSSLITARLPSGDSVSVLLYGATVTSWKSEGGKRENLWLSEGAKLDGSKAVRGGIPLVFPVCFLISSFIVKRNWGEEWCFLIDGTRGGNFVVLCFSISSSSYLGIVCLLKLFILLTALSQVFGPPPKSGHPTSSLPQHGLARTQRWEFLGKSTSEDALDTSSPSVKLDFGLYSSNLSEDAKKQWPYEFGLVYSVTLAEGSLQTVMNVRNEGKEAFEFQVLLHTYLRVEVCVFLFPFYVPHIFISPSYWGRRGGGGVEKDEGS